MESSQSCAATLTHYSTDPLTTGPDYDPLLLLLALTAQSRSPNIQNYTLVREDRRLVPGGGLLFFIQNSVSFTLLPHTPTMSDKTFNILQWNANGICNKQTELSIFLEAHDVKVAAIQESKLTAQSRSPNIENYILVRQDRRQGPGGGLLFFFHNSVSFTRKPLSTTSKNDPHLEELTISIAMDNTRVAHYQRVHPPASSCNGCYSPTLDHLLTGTDSLVLGDFNAQNSLWHSGTTDTRGNQVADSLSISSSAVLNTDSPTRLYRNADPSYPHVSLASSSLITSSEWQTHTTMSSDYLPILIGLQTTATSSPASCPAKNLHQPQEG